MKYVLIFLLCCFILVACNKKDANVQKSFDNPEIALSLPAEFPATNSSFNANKPTKYGVELGAVLFNDKRLSADNTISCASCHQQYYAFADTNAKAIGIEGRVGLRNAPPIQNMAFMTFFNWDGNVLQLEKQPLVPIITHEEMNSSIVEVIGKIGVDQGYKSLFIKAFGDESITPDRIYKSIAQYEYTLISANSKYDNVKKNKGATFTVSEARGYELFKAKCSSCHSTELFTDQSFRNIGFPINTNKEEAGRARLTGREEDYMAFRVPSLRNAEYTAPYGSFGQFPSLIAVLEYMDKGVIYSENLDPILKENNNRIPMTKQEQEDIISFIKTLSDPVFTAR